MDLPVRAALLCAVREWQYRLQFFVSQLFDKIAFLNTRGPGLRDPFLEVTGEY